ncbi:MAG: RagB/SusD family nutrient uptake outer membrane protein, partial [Bacteroidales bacterium]|nr:RagB/SusD family nutrient uptake outer membrane protein [Bacteroidales bacterium]
IAAEANAQAGNAAKAKELLNALQTARHANLTDGSMDSIKKEWYRETVGEGLIISNVKRWGDGFGARTPQEGAASLIMQGAAFEQRTMPANAYQFTWPVPTYEMQVNPNLVQNEGF